MQEPVQPSTPMKKFQEAVRFFIAGIIMLLVMWHFSDVVMAVMKFVLYVIGVVLVLAGIGGFSECIRNRNPKKE